MSEDVWADAARCSSCGHHKGRGCGCSCCGPWPVYQRCVVCGLHYRTGRYADHKHRAVRRGV